MQFFADSLSPTGAPIATAASNEALFFYLFAGAVSFLIVNGCLVLGAILAIRRKPSIEAEFATKAELLQLKGEMKQDIGIIFGKMDTLTSSVNRFAIDVSTSIGKLEGHREFAREIVEAVRNK